MGDSQHTQNIQINKVISKSKKSVFHVTEITKRTFWPIQYKHAAVLRVPRSPLFRPPRSQGRTSEGQRDVSTGKPL